MASTPTLPDLEPCPGPFNAAAYVLQAGSQTPDKVALMILSPSGAERWSYARLIAAVRGCGTGLLAKGLRAGDRVLLRLSNSAAFPLAFLGAIAVGVIPVPVSAQLTASEVQALISRIGPALIVADPSLALPPCDLPVLSSSEVLAMERLTPCDWSMGDPDRSAYAIFTSGTSGRPMPVLHAHRAVWARRMMHRGWESIGPSDRVFHAGALNWTFTLGTGLLDPWTLGATALIPGPGLLPSVFPLLLRRHDATIFAGAPGAIRQMLRAPVPALPRLRHGLSAGETLLPSLRAEWRTATGTDLHEALGMSECSTYISGSPERPAPDGFAGYAQPSRRIALLDGETGLAGADQGEIAIHRDDPGLMLGYLEEPKATAARYRGDWFLTGDIASQGPDGAFRYLGRADDLMNAGGYRVSPAEVEAALSGVPGVDDLAVLSREVRPGVGVIACVYVADADRSAELAERAGLVLARYKQPREFRRTNALPRNPNGKLNRGKLHQLWDVKA